MKYLGEDKGKKTNRQFLEHECKIEETASSKENYRIEIYLKKTMRMIALIDCFGYRYKKSYNGSYPINAMHIKSLAVTDWDYLHMGIGTYLVKSALRFAEKKRVRYVTVTPCATTMVISQKDLESFYHKFRYSTIFKRNKMIEFKQVYD